MWVSHERDREESRVIVKLGENRTLEIPVSVFPCLVLSLRF